MSVFGLIGYQPSDCGYCKDETTGKRNPESSANYYAALKSLTVEHYQDMVERGWRRSGTIAYKPDLRRACCPHYTIRLPAKEFYPSRNLRKTLNRWNNFVLGEKYLEAARRQPKTKADKARQKSEFNLLESIHASESSHVGSFATPAHTFTVALEHDTFTDEKYTLFEQYQRLVHKEKPSQISRSGFRRFLCDSPLVRSEATINGTPQRRGSYHHTYRLDGRLVAMAVLDLLPHTVSAVYFIYDVALEEWALGKLSALREAALAVEGGYEYYCMGYYIHSCAKMRYKAEYKPQFVLDPLSYEWWRLDAQLMARMDEHKFVAPSLDADDSKKQTELQYPDPAEAAASGLSIFDLDLNGITPLAELRSKVDLDYLGIMLRPRPNMPLARLEMRHLQSWHDGGDEEFSDPSTLKGMVAELAAAAGPVVAADMALSFEP